MKYTSKSLTNVGKVRSANEDNLGEAVTPNGHLFVVCDGMGGHVGGAQASTIAVNSIIEYFQREVYDNLIQAIDHALSFANEQIYASALNNTSLKGMGTTAVVLLVRGEECFIGHVGDSRIYLRSNGKLNRITKDHSFVQTLVDSGVIDDEDAENHPNKNQILQALGIAPSVKATISQSPILPKSGDMFLLCSDGLNGMVKDRDIERIMQEDNLMVTSENLITAALNGGGHDNITASLVLIEESAHTSSRFVHFNPKPKMMDMTSTQQFGGGSKLSAPKKSKIPYFIAAGVVIVGVIFAVFVLSGKEDVNVQKSTKKHTLLSLQSATDCENIQSGDSVVELQKDTIINIKCKSDSLRISIKGNVIDTKTTIETKINLNEGENQSLEVNEQSKNENGVKKEKDKTEKKDELIIKTHTVKEKETLLKIVESYIKDSPGLNVESLKDFNVEDKSSKLTDKQKADLSADKIAVGMKLKIPKMAK
jgi:serine/threonine protein phosphatase PrpC